jgi:hypothetical protein
MESIVNKFEQRTGKQLKDREKGVLGELVEQEIKNFLKSNLSLSTRTERMEDLDGIPMGFRKKLVLSFDKEVIASVPVSDVGMRY